MFMVERVEMINYPFFPDLRRDGFAEGHLALSGLQNVVMNWSSSLKVDEKLKDRQVTVLLKSSPEAWKYKGTSILPSSIEEAETAFQPEGEVKRYPLAVAVTGKFPSFFADRPSPLFGAAEGQKSETQTAGSTGDKAEKKEADRTGRTIKESAPEARLAVVGSSEFASDLAASLGEQMSGGEYRNNFLLVRNLVDWAVADTDLLEIRGSGAFARTLKPMEEKEKSTWEVINYIFVLAALGGVIAVAAARRRRARKSLIEEVAS
jgi:ABC-2 type transport system permease protein